MKLLASLSLVRDDAGHHKVRARVLLLLAFVIFHSLGITNTHTCIALDSANDKNNVKTLESVRQVRRLSLEEAETGIPVRLRGVVTYYDQPRHFGFIQDESGGTHFVGKSAPGVSSDFQWPAFSAGDRIELTGVTARGNFSPFLEILAGSQNPIRPLEPTAQPSPIIVPVQRLLNPGNHNQLCEVAAILTGIQHVGPGIVLQLNSGGIQFRGFIPMAFPDGSSLESLRFTEVLVTGVYGALFDQQGQLVGLELFIPSIDSIRTIGSGPGRLFDQEPSSLKSLLRFRDESPERVLIQGVVLLQIPEGGIYLRTEQSGLWVETDSESQFAPGDLVKVVGHATPGELQPYLSDAIIQLQSKGVAPSPRFMEPSQAMSLAANADLVTLTARLLSWVDLPDNRVMLMQGDDVIFTARCPSSTMVTLRKPLAENSWLELTGVCVVNADGTWQPADLESPNRLMRTPASFSLLMRDSNDIVLLHAPSWWTAQRLFILATSVLLVAVCGFVWAGLLRHRLSVQTAMMAKSIDRESTQRERERIARDLHDSIQQNLTGILHQLDSTSNRLSGVSDHAAKSLNLTKRMLHRSLEDVRCAIWDLRSESSHSMSLNSAIQEILLDYQESEKVCIRFFPSLRSDCVPGIIQHHLTSIIKEAIHNSIQHARASQIEVRLNIDGEHLSATVTDDGIGFETESVSPANGHFGLIGMKERAAKIHGEIQVTSGINHGTTVSVVVPWSKIVSERNGDE